MKTQVPKLGDVVQKAVEAIVPPIVPPTPTTPETPKPPETPKQPETPKS